MKYNVKQIVIFFIEIMNISSLSWLFLEIAIFVFKPPVYILIAQSINVMMTIKSVYYQMPHFYNYG